MSQLREIVLDTETTGLYTRNGDRIIEIGCVELINRRKTGAFYHQYLNPEKTISEEAFKIHGISNEFLADKPIFARIAKEFLEFIGTSPIVIHNATFDINFLNHELGLIALPELQTGRVVDTLIMARKKYPGSPASLDALCRRFQVSLDTREKHGALIDADLLASVYIELAGGNQSAMKFDESRSSEQAKNNRIARQERTYTLTEEEIAAHEKLVERLNNPIWKKLPA